MKELSHAEKLLQSLGVTTPAEIDVEAIAWHVGAEVRYSDLDSCEARIIGYGDRAIITVERKSISARKRFSVAHELGHWKHHRGRSFVCRKQDIGNEANGGNQLERVADAYAADLVLPPYLFEPLAKLAKKATFEAIDDLSREFQTSRTATALRMVDYGPEPAMLICHNQQKRLWFRRGRTVPERWFPRDEIDAESSALEVLHGRTERTRRSLIGADAWFDRREAERFEVFEQTIKSQNGTTISLIVFKSPAMLD